MDLSGIQELTRTTRQQFTGTPVFNALTLVRAKLPKRSKSKGPEVAPKFLLQFPPWQKGCDVQNSEAEQHCNMSM